MKTDQQKTYCGLEFLESLEKIMEDDIKKVQKKHGKIITDTTTTKTNKKLNEI